MSQWRGRLEENPELARVLTWFDNYYHVVFGVLLIGFMLWHRVKTWSNFVVDGQVYFPSNDPWYHHRTVTYTVQNWPATMPFDPWTYFPNGTASGQFGTFFDQIIATAALIVGLGSPDSNTIALTLLFAPVVFGLVAALPTYVIGRRVGGRLGGVTALTVLALSSGAFLNRSIVGAADHHIAEALFATLGVLGVMVAVSVAERDVPIYEQFVERDLDALRETVGWSVLAGVAVGLYIWVWPPGVLYIGVVGVFYLLKLSIDFVRGHSPEHVAIVGVIQMVTTALVALAAFQTVEITATDFSILHPLLALGVAAGCAFMAWLARAWEARGRDRWQYPIAIFGILLAGAVLFRLVAPETYGFFANNVMRVIGLSTSDTAATVREAQPLQSASSLYAWHGFNVVIAFIGAALVLAGQFFDERPEGQNLLLVVWLVFMTLATFTQSRFAYYLVFPVAGLTAYVIAMIARNVDLRPETGIETYQVITVGATILIVVAPMLVVTPTVMGQSDSNGAGQAIQAWDESLQGMQSNTPAEGTFGGADNEMDHYGTYEVTENYDYPEGAYGVMSWWDYGHWITQRAERVPNANPFQQGSTTAANFLLAPNETQSENVLERTDEDDAKTRYVMVDWKMANTYSQFRGKFFAPTQFYNESDVRQTDYTRRIAAGQGMFFRHNTENYYNTTVARLYQYHGSAAEPQPIVVDYEYNGSRAQAPTGEGARVLRTFNSTQEARSYVEEDGSATVGGIGGLATHRVPAMEHYRLVNTSQTSATSSEAYNIGQLYTALGSGLRYNTVASRSDCTSDVTVEAQGGQGYYCVDQSAVDLLHPTEPQWTKTFERVPGATIEGTGPANATVSAGVEMYNPASGETFTYTQRAQTDANGAFEMTVPYSTTGYDEYDPENGYTNVSVRANSSYQFQAITVQNQSFQQWTGSTDVSEGDVNGAEDGTVEVALEQAQAQNGGGNESSAVAAPTDGGAVAP